MHNSWPWYVLSFLRFANKIIYPLQSKLSSEFYLEFMLMVKGLHSAASFSCIKPVYVFVSVSKISTIYLDIIGIVPLYLTLFITLFEGLLNA